MKNKRPASEPSTIVQLDEETLAKAIRKAMEDCPTPRTEVDYERLTQAIRDAKKPTMDDRPSRKYKSEKEALSGKWKQVLGLKAHGNGWKDYLRAWWSLLTVSGTKLDDIVQDEVVGTGIGYTVVEFVLCLLLGGVRLVWCLLPVVSVAEILVRLLWPGQCFLVSAYDLQVWIRVFLVSLLTCPISTVCKVLIHEIRHNTDGEHLMEITNYFVSIVAMAVAFTALIVTLRH